MWWVNKWENASLIIVYGYRITKAYDNEKEKEEREERQLKERQEREKNWIGDTEIDPDEEFILNRPEK